MGILNMFMPIGMNKTIFIANIIKLIATLGLIGSVLLTVNTENIFFVCAGIVNFVFSLGFSEILCVLNDIRQNTSAKIEE